MKMLNNELQPPEPWMDETGRPLEPSALRFISKYWDHETWNRYLDSMETPLRSTVLCPLSVPFFNAPTAFLKLHAHIHELSRCHKLLLHLRFWESLTIEEISERLELSWTEVDEEIEKIQDHLRTRIEATNETKQKMAA